MSGGYFNYNQYRITDIAEQIKEIIRDNEDGIAEECYIYSEKTIDEFRNAVYALCKAAVYAQRIDWLLCSDDGEETFHERLFEDLENI
jgi:hypothetical protein